MHTFDILKIILNIAELAACITGFCYWKKIRNSYWKTFPFYLALIVLAELTGKYLNARRLSEYKIAMYSYIVVPMEILFFTWLFFNEFRATKIRWLPVAGALLYITCLLADTFFISGYEFWFRSFSYTAGILIMMVMILTFLNRLAVSNDILSLKTNMMFWVCIGLLAFYLVSLPFFGMGNMLLKNYKKIYFNYAYITYAFNTVMYLFFIIAFVWGKPKSSFS